MRVLATATALLAALTAACTFTPQEDNCVILCGQNNLCPERMTCGAGGYCYAGDLDPLCTSIDAAVSDAGETVDAWVPPIADASGDAPGIDAGIEPAKLTASATSHDFQSALIYGSTAAVDITVSNTGDLATGTVTAELQGSDFHEFDISADTCSGNTVLGGDSCTVSVRFGPQTVGEKSTTLSVSADPGGEDTVSLSGSARELSISPSMQDFGSVVEGQCSGGSGTQFTVSHQALTSSGALSVSLAGTDSDQFSITADGCTDATLATAGASCQVSMEYCPSLGSLGAQSATLYVSATPGGSANATLDGTALTLGDLSINPGLQSYGSVTVGEYSSYEILTVTNDGASGTGLLTTTLGGADTSDFQVGSDSCDSTTLAGGGSCTIAVRFGPTQAGARAATVTVSATPGGTAIANLSGTGLAPAQLSINPGSYDFGSVPAGNSSGSVTFTVSNTGEAASGVPSVEISGTNPTDFVITMSGCTVALAGGASCDMTLQFSPGSTGPKAASLDVSATPGGACSSSLTGTGTSL